MLSLDFLIHGNNVGKRCPSGGGERIRTSTESEQEQLTHSHYII